MGILLGRERGYYWGLGMGYYRVGNGDTTGMDMATGTGNRCYRLVWI